MPTESSMVIFVAVVLSSVFLLLLHFLLRLQRCLDSVWRPLRYRDNWSVWLLYYWVGLRLCLLLPRGQFFLLWVRLRRHRWGELILPAIRFCALETHEQLPDYKDQLFKERQKRSYFMNKSSCLPRQNYETVQSSFLYYCVSRMLPGFYIAPFVKLQI